MARKPLFLPLLLLFFAGLSACRNSTALLFPRNTKDESKFDIQSLDDGTFMKSGQLVAFELDTDKDVDAKTLAMEITLSSSDGKVQWSNKVSGPTLNAKQEFLLPDLPEGAYTLVFTVFQDGNAVEKKTAVFFATSNNFGIVGISSFPSVIGASTKVLLTAGLAVPEGQDPFLRWSSKGKVIKSGKMSAGLDRIFWTAPPAQGVYPILLELFPSSPAEGEDFPFLSSCSLTADLFVTRERKPSLGDLAPEDSYYALFHMQADLTDSAAAARKAGRPDPKIIGAPQIVTVGDGFGYRLDGSSGFQFPWLILPVEGGILKPFTVHLGLQWDREIPAEAAETPAGEQKTEGRTILSVRAENDAFTLLLREDPETRIPWAVLSVSGTTVEIPSGFDTVVTDRRTLLSLSVVAEARSVTVQWFQDGNQKTVKTVPVEIKNLRSGGLSVLGGPRGFAGTIDELGIYYRDADGRPTSDPAMFAMAAKAAYGKQVVLAEGFDGCLLAKDFTLSGEGFLGSGIMALSPEGQLTLPPLSPETDAMEVNLGIAEGSPAGALIVLSAKDSKEPILSIPVPPEELSFQLVITETSASLRDAAGKHDPIAFPKTAPLILSVVNPKDRKVPLRLENVLVLRRGAGL